MKADELSCKDLMVGDWVQGNPCGQHCDRNNNTYYKIAVLDIGNHCWGYSVCGAIVELKYDNIFSIPLTPEILEKNGFKRDPLWHHCDKDLDNYSISVQLGYANRIEYVKIAEKGKDDVIPSERTKLYLTHIKYVHQIQQALRLCGIKEIIEL